MRRLDAREPCVEAAEVGAEPGMVDPEAVQDGGMKVAEVDRVLDHVVRELVGRAILEPGANPPPASQTVKQRP